MPNFVRCSYLAETLTGLNKRILGFCLMRLAAAWCRVMHLRWRIPESLPRKDENQGDIGLGCRCFIALKHVKYHQVCLEHAEWELFKICWSKQAIGSVRQGVPQDVGTLRVRACIQVQVVLHEQTSETSKPLIQENVVERRSKWSWWPPAAKDVQRDCWEQLSRVTMWMWVYDYQRVSFLGSTEPLKPCRVRNAAKMWGVLVATSCQTFPYQTSTLATTSGLLDARLFTPRSFTVVKHVR